MPRDETLTAGSGVCRTRRASFQNDLLPIQDTETITLRSFYLFFLLWYDSQELRETFTSIIVISWKARREQEKTNPKHFKRKEMCSGELFVVTQIYTRTILGEVFASNFKTYLVWRNKVNILFFLQLKGLSSCCKAGEKHLIRHFCHLCNLGHSG